MLKLKLLARKKCEVVPPPERLTVATCDATAMLAGLTHEAVPPPPTSAPVPQFCVEVLFDPAGDSETVANAPSDAVMFPGFVHAAALFGALTSVPEAGATGPIALL